MSLVSTPFSTEENGARNQGIARAFCRMLVRFLPPMSVNKETSCGKIPGFHCELKKLEERTSYETSEGRNLIFLYFFNNLSFGCFACLRSFGAISFS